MVTNGSGSSLKWNKIILAAKIILFHFGRFSMLKLNTKILQNTFILTWTHGFRFSLHIYTKDYEIIEILPQSQYICEILSVYTFEGYTRRPASADRTARRQFQATSQPVSRTSDAMTWRLPRYEAKCV